MGLVAPEWSMFFDVSDGRVEDAVGQYLLDPGSMSACRAFQTQTEAMCWLTDPLTKEAVSNAREDGAAVGRAGGKGWLAVSSSYSSCAFAVERQGVRRAISCMAPKDAGLTLLRRFETAAGALSWLSASAPRDVRVVMDSSSAGLPPRALDRELALLSPLGSALSRNVMPKQGALRCRRPGGGARSCGAATSDLVSTAALASCGDGGWLRPCGMSRPGVESFGDNAVGTSAESLPLQAPDGAVARPLLCFQTLAADDQRGEYSYKTPAPVMGVRGGAPASCGSSLGKRRRLHLPGKPSADLNPVQRTGDRTDGMLSLTRLETMRIENKQY